MEVSNLLKSMSDQSLLLLRQTLTQHSLSKAALRLALQHAQCLLPATVPPRTLQIEPIGSQVVDDRVPSCCCFHPLQPAIAVSGWSGKVTIWSLPDAQPLEVKSGHTDRVNSVTYSPSGALLTASADTNLTLWTSTPTTFRGHLDRVNDAVFLGVETAVASVSHDLTMRLWDVTTGVEVLRQEGHARPIYALAGHIDGSLLVTGDLGGVALVWDLRTGKAIMHLRGHLKQLLSLSISPNGYTVASGSDDNTVKIWDLRRHGLIYTIPAHEKLVSSVLCTEDRVYSGSYDHTVKVWNLKDWSLEATLPHSNKVTNVRFSADSSLLATCSFDRTLKLFRQF